MSVHFTQLLHKAEDFLAVSCTGFKAAQKTLALVELQHKLFRC